MDFPTHDRIIQSKLEEMTLMYKTPSKHVWLHPRELARSLLTSAGCFKFVSQ